MTDYVYLCPYCLDCLYVFDESHHDREMVLPCQSCGRDIELWNETPDERESNSWNYTHYGSPSEVLRAVDRPEVSEE